MSITSVPGDKILFLLKTMRHEYLDDTIKKGRFCFNQPALFSKWEDKSAAQADRWEAHDAYEATHLIIAPYLGVENGQPKYGKPINWLDKAIIHTQNRNTKLTYICCFRAVSQKEINVIDGDIFISLGNTVDRIEREFGHDSFILVPVSIFLNRFDSKVNTDYYARDVIYADLLNEIEIDAPAEYQEVVEQLFRKDKKFEWQQEFRIALPPDPSNVGQRKFVEIGSIEDISWSGDLSMLKNCKVPPVRWIYSNQ